MGRRATVQNSPELDEIRAEYERLWTDMQQADATKAMRILERGRRKLSPPKLRLIEMLKPLRSRLLWAIPLGTVTAIGASYAAFIWIALWVE